MSEWSMKIDRALTGITMELERIAEQQRKDGAALNRRLDDLEKKVAALNRK